MLAIIDDTSNVGGVTVPGGSYCVVSGDLELYSEGRLRLGYVDADAVINDGDLVVTSNTSATYFPGIAIGYASDVQISSNNIIQSGYITPIADFSDMDAVLVIVTPFTESSMSDSQMASEMAGSADETETEGETAGQNETEGV